MISLIVAYDKNRVIGINNKLPWHYKEDLAYFKKVTTGHDMLMGRLTFESILTYRGAPLPNRHHYVATTSATYDMPEVTTVSDLAAFIANYPSEKELFIIGGATLFEATLLFCDRLYITHIKAEYEGDTWFPEVNFEDFLCSTIQETDTLAFAIYERKKDKC